MPGTKPSRPTNRNTAPTRSAAVRSALRGETAPLPVVGTSPPFFIAAERITRLVSGHTCPGAARSFAACPDRDQQPPWEQAPEVRILGPDRTSEDHEHTWA